MSSSFLEFLKEKEVEHLKDEKLSKYSYIGIGGIARLTVFPKSEKELCEVVCRLTHEGAKYKLVGNMTNILPPDLYYDGVIVKTSKMSYYYVAENELLVSSGASFIPLVRNLAELCIGGFEPLSGIPGSVGGMIYNNAGAYGSEISDNLIYADVYFPIEDKVRRLAKKELAFSYRDSILKHCRAVVLSSAFQRIDMPKEEIYMKIKEYKKRREETQPTKERSLGSTFLRHGGESVAKIIDSLGLCGVRIGDAEISTKHAGFIVNRGSCTAEDYISLVNFIKEKIQDSFGFTPNEEIEILK